MNLNPKGDIFGVHQPWELCTSKKKKEKRIRGWCRREWDGGEEKKIINVHTFGFNCYFIWLLFLNGRVTSPVNIIYIAQLTFPHVRRN